MSADKEEGIWMYKYPIQRANGNVEWYMGISFNPKKPIGWIVFDPEIKGRDRYTFHRVKQEGDWYQYPVYAPMEDDEELF